MIHQNITQRLKTRDSKWHVRRFSIIVHYLGLQQLCGVCYWNKTFFLQSFYCRWSISTKSCLNLIVMLISWTTAIYAKQDFPFQILDETIGNSLAGILLTEQQIWHLYFLKRPQRLDTNSKNLSGTFSSWMPSQKCSWFAK